MSILVPSTRTSTSVSSAASAHTSLSVTGAITMVTLSVYLLKWERNRSRMHPPARPREDSSDKKYARSPVSGTKRSARLLPVGAWLSAMFPTGLPVLTSTMSPASP